MTDPSDTALLIRRLRQNADDCDDMERWATPELSPLLRQAADALSGVAQRSAWREALEDIATLKVTGGAAANRALAALEGTECVPAQSTADGMEWRLKKGIEEIRWLMTCQWPPRIHDAVYICDALLSNYKRGPMVPWELKCQQHVCTAPECDCHLADTPASSPHRQATGTPSREPTGEYAIVTPVALHKHECKEAPILAAECRALIKRIDDLLHDDDAEAAHVDLHELAHKFEQCVAAVIVGEPHS